MTRQTHPELSIENNTNLLHIIQQSPSMKWIEEYLDLVKELIEFTEIGSQDPRF